MKIRLVEFNSDNNILRGILAVPDGVVKEAAVFLQGFERNTTVEKKFRCLADALAARGVASLRYDAAGCGLSDGDFFKTTLRGRADELMAAVGFIRKEIGVDKISFVGHSLGICALALKLKDVAAVIEKMVFIAPALNQRGLLRYYYVREIMKEKEPAVAVGWRGYGKYLREEKFLKDYARTSRTMRENYIGPSYFMEAKNLDLSNYFDKIKEKILHVHGEFDRSVPLESLNTVYPNRIIIPGGDHDLERPDFFEKWFPRAVDFLAP